VVRLLSGALGLCLAWGLAGAACEGRGSFDFMNAQASKKFTPYRLYMYRYLATESIVNRLQLSSNSALTTIQSKNAITQVGDGAFKIIFMSQFLNE
jgi:hypothetical protein